MPYDETACLCVACDGGSLQGCAVVCLFGERQLFGEEGGFVVQAGDILEEWHQLGAEACVGAVGVGARRGCRGSKPVVGNDGAVRACPVEACFDIVDL